MEGVAKLIIDLPNGKSPGPDGIRKPDLLVNLSTTSNVLALIYNASIKTCKLPKQWKIACVTSIHKGDVELANNYRPVSSTFIPCKMMEHIILHYLNKALAKFFITDNMVSEEGCLVRPCYA